MSTHRACHQFAPPCRSTRARRSRLALAAACVAIIGCGASGNISGGEAAGRAKADNTSGGTPDLVAQQDIDACADARQRPAGHLTNGICELVVKDVPGVDDSRDREGRKFCSGSIVRTGDETFAVLTAKHCEEVIPMLEYLIPAGADPWRYIFAHCGNGAIYPLRAAAAAQGGGAWEPCADRDVGLMHIDTSALAPTDYFSVRNHSLPRSKLPDNGLHEQLVCASPFARTPLGDLCTLDYLAFLWRDAEQDRLCPTALVKGGPFAGQEIIRYTTWEDDPTGTNTVAGDSGSTVFLIDAAQDAVDHGRRVPLAAVIVTTADGYRLDLGTLPGLKLRAEVNLRWPDMTGVVAGNRVHGCFPRYSALWSRTD